MRTYETIFVLNPELGPDAVAEQIEFYKQLITKEGGEILTVEPWGKQTLAYPINNFTEGYYVLVQFNADVKFIEELEKRYKFNELVMRFVVVMIDEKKFKLHPRKEAVRKERKPRPEFQDGMAQDDESADEEIVEVDVEVEINEVQE